MNHFKAQKQTYCFKHFELESTKYDCYWWHVNWLYWCLCFKYSSVSWSCSQSQRILMFPLWDTLKLSSVNFLYFSLHIIFIRCSHFVLWVLQFSEKVLMKLSELNWLIVWTTATFTLESAAQIQIWETMDWKLLSRGERRWVEARKVAHKVTSSGLSRTIWPERNHGPATSSYWNTSSTGRDFIYTHIRPIINWLIR